MQQILNDLASIAVATIVITILVSFMGWAQSRGR